MSAVDKKRIADLEFMLAKYQDELVPMLNSRIEELIAALDDAVGVVRCKDCIYWKKAKVNSKGFLICPASGMEITARDFCSYGERRADDATD